MIPLRTAINDNFALATISLRNYHLPHTRSPILFRVWFRHLPRFFPSSFSHSPFERKHISLSISPFLSLPFALSFFLETCERASTKASPRKASSRAIPVITTTSIFVKSLSLLSSSPSRPFYPFSLTGWSFDLPLYKSRSSYRTKKSAQSPPPRDIFQIINFYECATTRACPFFALRFRV